MCLWARISLRVLRGSQHRLFVRVWRPRVLGLRALCRFLGPEGSEGVEGEVSLGGDERAVGLAAVGLAAVLLLSDGGDNGESAPCVKGNLGRGRAGGW